MSWVSWVCHFHHFSLRLLTHTHTHMLFVVWLKLCECLDTWHEELSVTDQSSGSNPASRSICGRVIWAFRHHTQVQSYRQRANRARHKQACLASGCVLSQCNQISPILLEFKGVLCVIKENNSEMLWGKCCQIRWVQIKWPLRCDKPLLPDNISI